MSTDSPIAFKPAGPHPLGIDVSDHNGVIDWAQVAHAGGVQFAYCKATEGTTFEADSYDRNFRGAQDNGLLVGAYHYLHPELDPIAQAEWFLKHVWRVSPGDLPPALDFEELFGAAPAQAIAAAVAWCVHVEQRLGRQVLLYTYPNFVIADLGKRNLGELTSRPLWWARYAPAPAPIYGGWTYETVWQFTSSGRVPGIGKWNPVTKLWPAMTDCNRFNGALDRLKAFAHLPGV